MYLKPQGLVTHLGAVRESTDDLPFCGVFAPDELKFVGRIVGASPFGNGEQHYSIKMCDGITYRLVHASALAVGTNIIFRWDKLSIVLDPF